MYYTVAIYRDHADRIIGHETLPCGNTADAHYLADQHARDRGATVYEVRHTCLACMEPFTTRRIKWNGGNPIHPGCDA